MAKTIPNNAVKAAFDGLYDHMIDHDGWASMSAVRAALEAAGVGELIEAIKWYASSDAWTLNQTEGPYGDYGARARAVLEKLGVK